MIPDSKVYTYTYSVYVGMNVSRLNDTESVNNLQLSTLVKSSEHCFKSHVQCKAVL